MDSETESIIGEFWARQRAWTSSPPKDQRAMVTAAEKDMRLVLFGLVHPDNETFFPGRIPGSIVSLIARGLYQRGHPTEAVCQAIGGLLRPTDDSAWISVSKVWRQHFVSYPRFKAWRSEGHVRFRKPWIARLQVHAGDWETYWHLQKEKEKEKKKEKKKRQSVGYKDRFRQAE